MAKKTNIPAPVELAYLEHLKKDKRLTTIINEPLAVLPVKRNIALRLIASIMSQQLSTKVATVIYNRFLALYDGKEPTAEQIVATPPETLRAIGLSNAKVAYVQNVARFVIDEKLTDKKLHALDNDAVIAYLTQIKGVGRWTVEMLLMFYLGREDVFAIDDLNLQQCMIKLYKLEKLDKKAQKVKMLAISAKWAPYRTHAARYLWGWKDGK